MDNTNKYDNKCAIHQRYDIKLICSTCKTVVCDDCIVTIHRGHSFDHINVESSKPIFEEFKNNHLRNLDNQIDINKELLNKSNALFQSLEDKHNENINTVTNEFKELFKLLPMVETDKIRQLVTLYDENKDINTNITTIVEDNLNNIKLIINKYKDTINQLDIEQIINNNRDNNNNNNNQHIEILKHCHQSLLLIKDNKNENEIRKLINQYKNEDIINNSEKVKNSIKEMFEISGSLCNPDDPKKVTVSGIEYFIYKNGSIITNSSIYVAIAPSVKTIEKGSIPNSVKYLVLLDGFNILLEEGMLPLSITHLFVGNIKKPLQRGSIPNRVSSLFLLDGFNQHIAQIPSSVQSLYLFDIPLTKFPLFHQLQIFKSKKYKYKPSSLNYFPIDHFIFQQDCHTWEPQIKN
ncbi:hypothetical protein ACTFIV_006095 [Dictyostelium citrinum]